MSYLQKWAQRLFRAAFRPGWKKAAIRSRELQKSVTSFINRPRFSELTHETLGQLPDDQLVQAIYDWVEGRLQNTVGRELQHMDSIPSGPAAIYLLRNLEYEAFNGGLDQFLDQHADDVPRTMQAAQILGLVKIAALIQKASDRLDKGLSLAECDAELGRLAPELSFDPLVVPIIRSDYSRFVSV